MPKGFQLHPCVRCRGAKPGSKIEYGDNGFNHSDDKSDLDGSGC